jgi:hypothetical protein
LAGGGVFRGAGSQRCRAEFARREQSAVEGFLPGDTWSQLDVKTEFEQVNSDLILLPVYLVTYRYRNKLYRFLLNGQTGRAWGPRPLSGRRIALAIAAGVALIVVLVLLIRGW